MFRTLLALVPKLQLPIGGILFDYSWGPLGQICRFPQGVHKKNVFFSLEQSLNVISECERAGDGVCVIRAN